MTLLDKYINFKNISIDESCLTDNDYFKIFKKESKKCKHFSDNEINELDDKLEDKYFNMITDASSHKYKKNDDPVTEDEIEYDIDSSIFLSTDKKYVVFYLMLGCEEDGDQNIFGVINLKENKYLFVGNSGMHPFINTTEFSYGNSDGSGPEIKIDTEKITVYEILVHMTRYYTLFTNDMYH